eukprot:357524_1
MIKDVVVIYKMLIQNNQIETDLIIKICAICSVVFVAVPFIANLFYAAKIKTFISTQNIMANAYFANYSGIFVGLVCVCGGCYPALAVVSSAIFGLDVLNSGLTNHELRELNKIKVVSTIFLENIPQLLIQIVYSL